MFNDMGIAVSYTMYYEETIVDTLLQSTSVIDRLRY